MAHAKNHDYHILPPSIWPVITAASAFVMLIGAVFWMHGLGPWLFFIGLTPVLYGMVSWFTDLVREAQNGEHSEAIRIGLRIGFLLFIVSEVFFFFAWFWSFFKNAIFPMDAINNQWPPAGIETFDPWHLPLINTLILLLSGTFVTWAHHQISHEGNREALKKGLVYAVILGVSFTFFQVYEYSHAAFGLSGNIYGSNFYFPTGFHGFHVIVGTIFLLVCLLRARAGHFTKEAHVGFEAAAWYWHFVDVVWIFLFVSVYVWGSQ